VLVLVYDRGKVATKGAEERFGVVAQSIYRSSGSGSGSVEVEVLYYYDQRFR
jgi:hypothetical protein